MIQYDDYKQRLVALAPELDLIKASLSVDRCRAEIAQKEAETSGEGFWSDPQRSSKVQREIKALRAQVETYEAIRRNYEDTLTLLEIAVEEDDESLLPEVTEAIEGFEAALQSARLSTLLTGEYDHNNAIMTFHAGAGGTEAQDWVEMLYRLYNRYAARHGYKAKVLDYLDGEEAGIKSATLLIEGGNAYGFLKSEAGVHRLVRISPFDSSGRRHTSFASVEVMPEIEDDAEITIAPDDLKVDTYRSGGAGGQHVNKTESAIRITHLPTGIVVACQNERSQHQNREVAMKMLRAKLAEIKEREHLEKIEDIRGVKNEIAWGSQIRSYVFMPYTLAKDHRTGHENGNIAAVMDGEIDGFINAYLVSQREQK